MAERDDTVVDKAGASTDAQEAPAEHERDPLTRKIAVSLAALIVLGAGMAVLQTDASVNESQTARETTRIAVRSMSAAVVAETVAGLRSSIHAEREFLPFRRPLDPAIPSLAAAAGLASPAGTASGAQSAVPELGAATMLPRLQTEARRRALKQHALAATRITWNDRATQYTTVIAVLAAALFLVGFALIAEGAIRRTAYMLGLVVGLFAAGWAAWIYHLPIPSTPDAAISAAARGAILTGLGDYRPALAQYDRAIEVDDGFAAAYTGRARARLLEANPDYPVTRAFTERTRRASSAAVRDAERALELEGHRDLLTVGLVALTSFYDGNNERALTITGEALDINRRVPDVWLLRSAAQVAVGDQAGAHASLARARALLRGTEPSQRTRLLASTYLSYLAWVERKVPSRARAARQLSNSLVSTETAFTLGHPVSGAAPAQGRVSVDGLRYADGKLMLRLRWRNLPKGTALSLIGYERPLAGGAWNQPPDLALFATVGGSGERSIAVPVRRACKPTEVRADAFVDGAPVLSRTGPGEAQTC